MAKIATAEELLPGDICRFNTPRLAKNKRASQVRSHHHELSPHFYDTRRTVMPSQQQPSSVDIKQSANTKKKNECPKTPSIQAKGGRVFFVLFDVGYACGGGPRPAQSQHCLRALDMYVAVHTCFLRPLRGKGSDLEPNEERTRGGCNHERRTDQRTGGG